MSSETLTLMKRSLLKLCKPRRHSPRPPNRSESYSQEQKAGRFCWSFILIFPLKKKKKKKKKEEMDFSVFSEDVQELLKSKDEDDDLPEGENGHFFFFVSLPLIFSKSSSFSSFNRDEGKV